MVVVVTGAVSYSGNIENILVLTTIRIGASGEQYIRA